MSLLTTPPPERNISLTLQTFAPFGVLPGGVVYFTPHFKETRDPVLWPGSVTMPSFTDNEKKVLAFTVVIVTTGTMLQLSFKWFPTARKLRAVIDDPRFYPKVNVNRATLDELIAIPDLGQKGAERIIQARRDKPFDGPQDLSRAGFGPRMIAKLSVYLFFGRHS